MREADCSPDQADAIYRLTALSTFDERFVIPAGHRSWAWKRNRSLKHKRRLAWVHRKSAGGCDEAGDGGYTASRPLSYPDANFSRLARCWGARP